MVGGAAGTADLVAGERLAMLQPAPLATQDIQQYWGWGESLLTSIPRTPE